MSTKKYDIIVLFSGGADSIMLYDFAKRMNKKVLYLLINYKQLHIEELDVATNFLKKHGVEKQHIRTVQLSNVGICSGLTEKGESGSYENVHPMHVPSRNLMFVSIAASIAESENISTIWYGADYSDRINLFPDCYQEWVVKVNELLKINGSKDIILECPIIGFTKETVLDYIKNSSYNTKEMFSGYGALK